MANMNEMNNTKVIAECATETLEAVVDAAPKGSMKVVGEVFGVAAVVAAAGYGLYRLGKFVAKKVKDRKESKEASVDAESEPTVIEVDFEKADETE